MLFLLLASFAVNTPPATLNCRKPNEYRLVVVQNPDRRKEWDSGDPDDVNILVGDEVIAKIELPKEGEAKNFQLDALKKTKAGFVIKVNWGASISHYEIQFNFRCKRNRFYLYRVKKVSLLTLHPDRGFWDTTVTKVTKPNVPIEKFVMTRYL